MSKTETDPVILEGFLRKPGKTLFTRRRFFQLRASTLYCFKSDDESELSWKLDLSDAIVTSIGEFEISIEVPDKKSVSLFALSQQEQIEWMKALEIASARKWSSFYDMGEKVGTGYNSSEVYHAVHKSTQDDFVMKVLTKSKLIVSFSEEVVKGLRFFSHPNLIRIYDIFDRPEELILVMEYANNGPLLSNVAPGYYTERDLRDIARQVITGLKKLTERGTCHGHLHPGNILVKTNPDSSIAIKLSDYGLFPAYLAASKNVDNFWFLVCDARFIAPEVLDKSIPSGVAMEADMWSLGMLLYVLVTGHFPWNQDPEENLNTQTLLTNIMDINYDTFQNSEWEKVTPNCKAFIQELLILRPEARMITKSAIHHRWLMGSAALDESMAQNILPIQGDLGILGQPANKSFKIIKQVASPKHAVITAGAKFTSTAVTDKMSQTHSPEKSRDNPTKSNLGDSRNSSVNNNNGGLELKIKRGIQLEDDGDGVVDLAQSGLITENEAERNQATELDSSTEVVLTTTKKLEPLNSVTSTTPEQVKPPFDKPKTMSAIFSEKQAVRNSAPNPPLRPFSSTTHGANGTQGKDESFISAPLAGQEVSKKTRSASEVYGRKKLSQVFRKGKPSQAPLSSNPDASPQQTVLKKLFSKKTKQ